MKLRFPSFRQLFQFRLKTFLFAVLVTGVLVGWAANAKVQQDRELAEINQLMTASAQAPYEVIRQTLTSGSQANGAGKPSAGLILM